MEDARNWPEGVVHVEFEEDSGLSEINFPVFPRQVEKHNNVIAPQRSR
tara:strand:- start:547 stop:690 length:144 start_codon:yes stop_codon:yes gene_type:complete